MVDRSRIQGIAHAQGVADDVSRGVKCAAAAKIKEMLAERGLELSEEKLQELLTAIGDTTYSKLWRGLAECDSTTKP